MSPFEYAPAPESRAIVDLNAVDGLSGIHVDDSSVRVRAMTRQRDLELVRRTFRQFAEDRVAPGAGRIWPAAEQAPTSASLSNWEGSGTVNPITEVAKPVIERPASSAASLF
jgi:hypothetical protein